MVGQLRAHRLQPVHLSSTIEYFSSCRHTSAGHLWSLMWASYSSRKCRSVLSVGFGDGHAQAAQAGHRGHAAQVLELAEFLLGRLARA